MKTVTIDELLSWAFVHELPKGGGVDGLENMNSAWRRLEASSWGKIMSFVELGAMIDAGRGDGANYFIEQGEPHEDAVEVGRAVAALGLCDVHVPDGWNCLTEWADTDGLAERAVLDVAARFRARTATRRAQGIVSLVIGTAILAREPGFVAERPKVRMVEREGKPAWFAMRRVRLPDETFHSMEVDGRDPRSRKPFRDAYRKYEFSDDPAGDIMGRLDYQIWVAALRHVEGVLIDKLSGHRLVHSDRSMTPWLERDMPGVRIVVRAGSERPKNRADAC